MALIKSHGDTTLNELYKLAANSPTREVCGLLVASDDDTGIEIIPIINVAKSGDQFVMHKGGYLRALRKLQQEDREIMAVYHSHPNGDPTPSQADIDAARRTGHNYLIVTNNQYKWVEV